MIPSNRKVCIHITTFQNMDDNKSRKSTCHNKFICSICLNTRVSDKEKFIECGKRISKSYPICYNKEYVNEHEAIASKVESQLNSRAATKMVQTSQTDVTHGLNLLNEVLAVFQNKKQSIQKENKVIALKDAYTTTEVNKYSLKPKLTLSDTFQFSIKDEKKINDKTYFTIIHFCQPSFIKYSQNSLDLIKHKSSSIPRMKMDELKNSLKEKTKSKDAIEEVNRMFATVKRNNNSNVADDVNRPMVRNGPRVLPVVKTKSYNGFKDEKYMKMKQKCKCCQTNELQMSSGDSLKLCQHNVLETRCDKCVYMLCCHYHKKQRKEMQAGILICKYCKNTVSVQTRDQEIDQCNDDDFSSF